jgi:hypothetical protein
VACSWLMLSSRRSFAAQQLPKPVFHPNMARVFEQKIRGLADALEHEDMEQRASRSSLRDLIKRIAIPPGDELLRVKGISGRFGSRWRAARLSGCRVNDS